MKRNKLDWRDGIIVVLAVYVAWHFVMEGAWYFNILWMPFWVIFIILAEKSGE